MYQILRREAFSETTFLWEVVPPDVARSAEPGHFVMVRLHDGSERIPLGRELELRVGVRGRGGQRQRDDDQR